MIPLLTLGIPGSTIAAVLIGVFIVHGLQVGPQIFDDQNQIIIGTQVMTSREFIFGLFAAGLVGIAAYGIIGFWAGPLIGRVIALIPQNYLYPFIFATAVAASYSSRSSIADVGFAILFGIIGYGMRRTNFSAAAFIIAFVLAGNMEESFRQAMMISDNGLWGFVTEPVSASFLAIGLGMVLFRSFGQARKIKGGKN
jgi:putative tricarboxylic transport membrane protein